MDSDRAGPDKIRLRPAVQLIISSFDFLFWLLTRPRFFGLENIPARGPFLMATNHLSYADPPLIAIALRRPDMVVLVADTYKKNPFFSWIVETVGAVWINRGSGDRGAIKAAVEVLKRGKILGMAPEGTRSKVTHALTPGKTGAAYIASRSGAPVLPIGIAGTNKVFSELKRLRRAEISITVGKPFTLPPLEGDAKGRLLDDYTHEIMCRIAALLPEEYQGVYKGDPRIEEIRRNH